MVVHSIKRGKNHRVLIDVVGCVKHNGIVEVYIQYKSKSAQKMNQLPILINLVIEI